MEINKVVKPFIRRGWPNTFGNIVYISMCEYLVIMYLHKEELGMEEGKRMSVWQIIWQVWERINFYILLIVVGGVTISWFCSHGVVCLNYAWAPFVTQTSFHVKLVVNRKGWQC